MKELTEIVRAVEQLWDNADLTNLKLWQMQILIRELLVIRRATQRIEKMLDSNSRL